jgi:hypothetical protein
MGARDTVPPLIAFCVSPLTTSVARFREFRNDVDGSTVYYPLIEKVRDSFGNLGLREDERGYGKPVARLDVGEVVTFAGSAFAADGNSVIWKIQKTATRHVSTKQVEVARGDGAEFSYRFTEDDVNEHLHFGIVVTTPSKYHRHHGTTDDIRYFHYQVNPPRPSTPNIKSSNAGDDPRRRRPLGPRSR